MSYAGRYSDASLQHLQRTLTNNGVTRVTPIQADGSTYDLDSSQGGVKGVVHDRFDELGEPTPGAPRTSTDPTAALRSPRWRTPTKCRTVFGVVSHRRQSRSSPRRRRRAAGPWPGPLPDATRTGTWPPAPPARSRSARTPMRELSTCSHKRPSLLQRRIATMASAPTVRRLCRLGATCRRARRRRQTLGAHHRFCGTISERT